MYFGFSATFTTLQDTTLTIQLNPIPDFSDDDFFVAVEVMPEPIGGIEAIQSKIIYTEEALNAGVEGIVSVLTFVDTEGRVVKAEIIEGVGSGLDEEAIRVIWVSPFIPGMQRGSPLPVRVAIPIEFKLP